MLRIFPRPLHIADILLQRMHVHICAWTVLHHLFHNRIFQGSGPDHLDRSPGRYMGDPDTVEYHDAFTEASHTVQA